MIKITSVKHISDFGFKELEIGRTYSNWIYSLVAPYLTNRIMEVGCGLGLMAQYYPEDYFIVFSDINKKFLNIVKTRYGDDKNRIALHLDITRLSSTLLKRLKNYKLSSIFSVNVLEHIENDSLALLNINKILQKKGNLVLFVPALPYLFGTLDKGFGHYRRYGKNELKQKMEKAGFEVIYIRYFNIIGVIWWYVAGRILRKDNIPATSGMLLKVIVPILRIVESVVPVPIGQSLIAVGRKK